MKQNYGAISPFYGNGFKILGWRYPEALWADGLENFREYSSSRVRIYAGEQMAGVSAAAARPHIS